MKRIASIDIGTNSVLYSLFELRGKSLHELHFERHSPRIGSKLKGKRKPRIDRGNYRNLLNVVRRVIKHARNGGAENILVAATNPLRLAKNGREIRQRLESDTGCRVSILSPHREAYFSFIGAVGRLKANQTAVIIDLGGGSTELVVYRGQKRLAFVSIPEGAVSLTEKFDTASAVDQARFYEFEKYLAGYRRQVLKIKPFLRHSLNLVGGTSSALAYIKDPKIFRERQIVSLTRADIELLVKTLAPLNTACRRRLLEIDKKRAELIFAGAFWLGYLFKILNISKAAATSRGLRHGLVIEHTGL